MKHEYTFEELAELRKIYNESGEGGLEPDEMRALRKAGLLTQGLPEKPSKTASSRTAKNASTKANRSTARKQPKR